MDTGQALIINLRGLHGQLTKPIIKCSSFILKIDLGFLMNVVFKDILFMMAIIINVSQFSCTNVHSLLEAILISFKIVVIFNLTSADFVLIQLMLYWK